MAPLLVVFGSGPGIGITTAKRFAQKHFTHVVLCARNADRLEKEKREVEEAAKDVGKNVTVSTVPVDLSDFEQLQKALSAIEKSGQVSTIFFNAARVQPSAPLTMPFTELIEDLHTTTVALYIIAQWGIPLLQRQAASSSFHPASLIVTSSHLPEEAEPYLLSLSAAKAAQQNIVHSLRKAYGEDIHIGLVKVCGAVSSEHKTRNAENIATQMVEFWETQKEKWGGDLRVE